MALPPLHVQLNGKFLAAAPTGVHRVAKELVQALAALIAEGHPATAGLSLEVLVPHDGTARAAALALSARRLGPMRHIPWEQLTLPLRRGPGLLLNLCNIGPVLARNAITMIHDAQVLTSPESYRPAFRHWYGLVQPIVARRHRRLLTVSEFSRRELVAAGLAPAERIAVVPNGVDHVLTNASDPRLRHALGLDEGRYVLALANTQAHKNVAMLLRAFTQPRLTALRLVLFGGAAREDFERLGHPVPPNVVFAGKVSDGELRALMERALCLAFPSTTEGFGLPPLEAMLLGCPAVVAPRGALPEICGDAALYAAHDDPASWAETIRALADSLELRVQYGALGQHRAAAFTWRAAALILVDVLQRHRAESASPNGRR